MIPQHVKDSIEEAAKVLKEKHGLNIPQYAKTKHLMQQGAEIALESQWIRVEDRMPDFSNAVLAYTKSGRYLITYYDTRSKRLWDDEIDEGDEFTHWMNPSKPTP